MNILEWIVPAAQAHEKWFVDGSTTQYAVPEAFVTTNPMTIAFAAGAAVLVAALFFVDRWFERSAWHAVMERKAYPLRDYAAGVLALTTAVTLFWMSANGALLADNLLLPEGLLGAALLGVQIAIGIMLTLGLYTAAAAIGILLLYGALFFLFPFMDVIDYLHYAAIGVFLLAFARGRFSLDWVLGKGMLTTAETRKRAYLALRVLTGAMILILALAKWARPDLHFRLMDAFPDFNPYTILRSFGADISRETYVYCLFMVEFVSGIVVLLGLLTRIVAVLLMPIFLVSVIFIGLPDVLGHLPIVGILFVLFVYGDTYHKGRTLSPTGSGGGTLPPAIPS
jgi:uncharacterized membrane protein YphA (DoxX/SURF4 family)